MTKGILSTYDKTNKTNNKLIAFLVYVSDYCSADIILVMPIDC